MNSEETISGLLRETVQVAKEIGQNKVRCEDCRFLPQVELKNPFGDCYCPVADKTLVGGANNHKTFHQPRICFYYKPKEASKDE